MRAIPLLILIRAVQAVSLALCIAAAWDLRAILSHPGSVVLTALVGYVLINGAVRRGRETLAIFRAVSARRSAKHLIPGANGPPIALTAMVLLSGGCGLVQFAVQGRVSDLQLATIAVLGWFVVLEVGERRVLRVLKEDPDDRTD